MREILFKAKRKDNKEWVEGYPFPSIAGKELNRMTVFEPFPGGTVVNTYEVDPETVCQYTGLTDKNGKKIFEGDILRVAKKSDGMGGYYFPPLEYPVNVSVKFDFCAYMWETIGEEKYYISFPEAWCHYECEIIGNIQDKEESNEE